MSVWMSLSSPHLDEDSWQLGPMDGQKAWRVTSPSCVPRDKYSHSSPGTFQGVKRGWDRAETFTQGMYLLLKMWKI